MSAKESKKDIEQPKSNLRVARVRGGVPVSSGIQAGDAFKKWDEYIRG